MIFFHTYLGGITWSISSRALMNLLHSVSPSFIHPVWRSPPLYQTLWKQTRSCWPCGFTTTFLLELSSTLYPFVWSFGICFRSFCQVTVGNEMDLVSSDPTLSSLRNGADIPSWWIVKLNDGDSSHVLFRASETSLDFAILACMLLTGWLLELKWWILHDVFDFIDHTVRMCG